MTLYRYACEMCFLASGAVPKRNLVDAVSGHVPIEGSDSFFCGIVDYIAPLTDEEIDMYDLVPMGTVEVEV